MSYHDKEEILVPPAGVCFRPPTVYKGLCPECKYFEGCTHHGKVDGTSAPKAKMVKRESRCSNQNTNMSHNWNQFFSR